MDRVFEVIKPATRKSDSKESRKRFLSVILGLSLTEFPFGATIEELNWFHYDLGIRVLDYYWIFRKRLNLTEKLVEEFINQYEFLQEYIKKENYKLKNTRVKKSGKGIPEITMSVLFSENFNPYLFDKSDIDLLLNWLAAQFKDRGKEEIKAYIDFSDELKKVWLYERSKTTSSYEH